MGAPHGGLEGSPWIWLVLSLLLAGPGLCSCLWAWCQRLSLENSRTDCSDVLQRKQGRECGLRLELRVQAQAVPGAKAPTPPRSVSRKPQGMDLQCKMFESKKTPAPPEPIRTEGQVNPAGRWGWERDRQAGTLKEPRLLLAGTCISGWFWMNSTCRMYYFFSLLAHSSLLPDLWTQPSELQGTSYGEANNSWRGEFTATHTGNVSYIIARTRPLYFSRCWSRILGYGTEEKNRICCVQYSTRERKCFVVKNRYPEERQATWAWRKDENLETIIIYLGYFRSRFRKVYLPVPGRAWIFFYFQP